MTPSIVSVDELLGLANWPAMRPILMTGCAPDLDHRLPAAVRADQGHLQDHAERVAHVVYRELVEGFRAITAKDHEAVALAGSS